MRGIACLVVCSALLGCLVGCTGLAKQEVRQLVDQEEEVLSRSRARVTDPVVTGYLSRLAAPILAAAQATDLDETDLPDEDETLNIYDRFSVYLVHDPMPNAWVVGDDFACVTTSLILLTEHPEELVFVLGHEYGHLRGEHMVESIERRHAHQITAALAGGLAAAGASYNAATSPYYSQQQYNQDMQGAMAIMATIMMAYSPHRKSDEHDSDEQAVELMMAAGYPIDRVTDYFERLIPLYGDGGGGSHPPTSKRIERLQKIQAELAEYRPTRRLDLGEFLRVRERVRAQAERLVRADQIVFFSDERQTLTSSTLPPLKSCGPLDADPEAIMDLYTKLVLGRR